MARVWVGYIFSLKNNFALFLHCKMSANFSRRFFFCDPKINEVLFEGGGGGGGVFILLYLPFSSQLLYSVSL